MSAAIKAMQSRIQHIHFIGIGGVGMGGIAEVLINLGYQISGSDIADNPLISRLRTLGANITIGHTAEQVAGADVVVLDGMQGGTAATQDVFIEHVGQPTLACIRPAVQALQDLGMHRKVQLVLSGGVL